MDNTDTMVCPIGAYVTGQNYFQVKSFFFFFNNSLLKQFDINTAN